MDKLKEKDSLSPHERQVLHILTQGDEYSRISYDLNMSINIVRFHVEDTKHKIQARNTNHAIHITNRNEIVQMGIDVLAEYISFFHQASRDSFPHYLNEEEIKRYDQFHLVSGEELYILSHILLKTTLKRYQPDVSSQSWQFSTCEYDKSFVVFPQLVKEIFFNLPYTIDTITVTISSHCELGINIERIRDSDNSYLNIGQHFSTPQEATNMISLSRYEGQLPFWKMWTLREAHIRY